MTSIATTLGIGSGIDTSALIDSLVAATRQPKDLMLAQREAANVAKVSALGQASNAIDAFATALSSLISGGTLFTQPVSSDDSIMTAKAQPGVRISNVSSTVIIEQLAQAQTLSSVQVASAADPIGQGELTLVTSKGSFAITIDADNDSLTGLAKEINDAKTGVTATVITETGGAKLVLKGATGEAEAFTLSVPVGTATGLERFAYDPNVAGGMTRAQEAKDAILKLDGVQVKRSANSIGDLIPGVQIDLKKAAPGSTLSLDVVKPTEAIRQSVQDFVVAYNEVTSLLGEMTAPADANGEGGGPLRGDQAIRDMKRQLSGLTSMELSTEGGPGTLAEIGVRTNRDGTLSVDLSRLDKALADDPDGVEAMFNPGQYSSSEFVRVTSLMGRTKPGTYQLTDLVPANGSTMASGKIAGVAAIGSGSRLIAAVTSAASGLTVEVTGAVASATVTVDPGLGGALQAIRDALRASTGALTTAQTRLKEEAEAIGEDKAEIEARSIAYRDQLVQSFTAMEKRVSAFKATQSYLEQQIEIWNNSRN